MKVLVVEHGAGVGLVVMGVLREWHMETRPVGYGTAQEALGHGPGSSGYAQRAGAGAVNRRDASAGYVRSRVGAAFAHDRTLSPRAGADAGRQGG
jgi:hypothetical protein